MPLLTELESVFAFLTTKMSPRRSFSRSAAVAKPSRSMSEFTNASGSFQRLTIRPALRLILRTQSRSM
jgi:hypothetical protein